MASPNISFDKCNKLLCLYSHKNSALNITVVNKVKVKISLSKNIKYNRT